MQETITKLTYEQIISVTHNPAIITLIIFIWIFPIILYITIAYFTRGKTASGIKLKTRMISRGNTWIAVIIWTFIQSGLLLLIIFPFWANIF